MTLNQLASQIAKREGKKSQARIGDIREILGVMADIFHERLQEDDVTGMDAIVMAGQKRAKRKVRGGSKKRA